MTNLLKCGGACKFTVLKNEDILNYLNQVQRSQLTSILDTINNTREVKNKSTNNEYIVINVDEPYAPEIIDILKKHGHWGII